MFVLPITGNLVPTMGKYNRSNVFSPPRVNWCHLPPLVAQFPADGLAGQATGVPLCGVRAASSRTSPAGEFLVAHPGIGVTQAVQLGESGAAGVAFVDPELVGLVATGRDERTCAGGSGRIAQAMSELFPG